MIRWFREIGLFILFVLFQALVINNIRLFGIVTPFVYLYFILKLRTDTSRSVVIVLSFLLGLSIDIFLNTYGIHAAACTLTGFIREPLLSRFVELKELPDGSIPSYNLFGFGTFFYYALIWVSIHHVILFLIDSFGFYQPFTLIIRLSTSIVLTLLIVLIIESFNLKKVKHGE